MAVRRHSRVVSRGSRRQTSWLDVVPTSTTVSGAGGTLLVSLTTAEKAKRPFTIIRTHLVAQLVSDQGIATEQYGGAIGFAVVSDQAEAIGITALPKPVADNDSNLWFVHQWMMGFFDFGTAASFIEQTGQGQNYVIDSKAMRKVEDGQDVVLVHELSTVLGDGQIIRVAGRLLIKEH